MTNTLKVPSTPKELSNLLNSDNFHVLKFSTSWCRPCKDEFFLGRYANMKKKLQDNFSKVKFMELIIDKEHEEVAENTQYYNFNISSIPCIALFNKGKELGRWFGTQCLDEVEEYIRTTCN